ncbi:hypothetical protein TPL01_10370 [Sulfuriferula plumbiphila]|uniref:type I site-specific deoxyribonuclease n=1 Tax=Sulfuriferula plumbiphila TaxID=171865 RepID=A0A512L5Y9_9PROT|nr:type I restriction endonuclease [Sulfuriferula plumbiphila]BBP05156.1 hypothetical protein SFPGR_25780 [Sulfuriferula plumbiphila]GEP29899.1 hypothetical protein TPL01_10370 [Sulfuriferula plumbiphila]
MSLNESIVEDAALSWFGELGYAIGHGPLMAPGEPAAERDSFGDVVLAGRLREAIRRLNPAIPEEAREDALRKVLRVGTPSLNQTNHTFHAMLRDGVPVEYPRADGSIAGDHARLVDFDNATGNDWLAVNQFTVIEGQNNRRPDIVVFVNGLPLAVIELLRQMPVQAESRERLRELLQVASGGVVFTTIQKFMPDKGEQMPALSPRRNIVVIADEAHRSQYDLIDGLARNLRDALPNASFIGFML